MPRAVLAVLALAVLVPSAAPGSSEAGSHAGVPILMYHVLADPVAGTPMPELWVSPLDFQAEMEWLDARGYHAVTLRQLWNHWRHGRPLPPRPIVISFDDGFRSHIRVALPTLLGHRWPGVLNLTASHLEPTGDLRVSALRRLLRAGWEIDSHTLSHPDLTALDRTQLQQEVAGSRFVLRRLLHVPVDFFCYPAGRYDARVVAAVRAAGYLGATTTRNGLALRGEPFTLARLRVVRSDGVAGLARKLAELG
jgi:peptidoglycan/xylan/chitin deacetylase (PgdA/CDA1 family)